MSIVILANETLSLHLVRFGNVVDRNQLFALHGAHERRRDWAGADTVHVIDGDADLSSVTSEHLNALRARYRVLHTSIEFSCCSDQHGCVWRQRCESLQNIG